MPDTLNKQAIVNLLIDSPLREPIKINLIDIVNNTAEPDLPKIYSTITKELEIFQKATERRMKLADETIAKLGGATPPDSTPTSPVPQSTINDLQSTPPLSVPPLDLPPLPISPVIPTAVEESPAPVVPNLQPLGAPVASPATDEDALSEIQKELDSLKTAEALPTAPPAAPVPTV